MCGFFCIFDIDYAALLREQERTFYEKPPEKRMRKGPHPLSVQIGLAASAQEPGGEFMLQPQGEMAVEIARMLLGIQKYQAHPFKAERPKLEIIWQEGEATIQAIPGYAAPDDQPILLLVPSMVNKGYILDLMEERSLLRWLGQQGVTPYLLDWGNGIEDEGQQEIEGIVLERLVPAIEFLAQQSGKKINVLGYCMGGTLLVGAAQYAAESIQSLIYLAAPWDFHAGTQTMLSRVKFWSPSAFPAIAEKGVLPMDWMQMLFASVDPKSAAKKFAAFVDMDEKSEQAKLFVAVEDWLNDGVDLPGNVAQQCIKEWFFMNAPAAAKWELNGETVDPGTQDIPALVITSDKDRLVDYETAAALAKAMKNAKIVNTGTGHIGMIAGSKAQEKVWKPIADWLKKQGA